MKELLFQAHEWSSEMLNHATEAYFNAHLWFKAVVLPYFFQTIHHLQDIVLNYLFPHRVIGEAIDWAAYFHELYWRIIALVRWVFKPVYFGVFFTAVYVYAWFRMESIAESKRKQLNSLILLKKSMVDQSINSMSLKDYCDQYKGQLFQKNTPIDILNSMTSKGKTPIKAVDLCQPVLIPSGPGILWQSNCVSLKTDPITSDAVKAKLYNDIRPLANMTIRDAAHVISEGFIEVYWRDPHKRFFSKEQTVYIRLNFWDAQNFVGLFQDPHGFKRLYSVSLDVFLAVKPIDVTSNELDFIESDDVGKVRLTDIIPFAAMCLFIAHAEIKQ